MAREGGTNHSLLVEQNQYFESMRIRQHGEEKRHFQFGGYYRVNNSPYVVVKGRQHMEIVGEARNNELGFIHNSAYISMKKALKRPDFVENMGESVHEGRFDLSDQYDKSTYLTRNER